MYYQFNSDIVPDTQQAFVKSLLDGKYSADSDRLLGFSKGRGTTWFLYTQPELALNCVLRHYYRGGLFGKMVKDRYWFNGIQRTRAAREFELLRQMYHWELPVPRPIAFKISRRCGTYQADILLEKIENTQDLSQFLQKNRLSAAEYYAIGTIIRQLHERQIHHSDLNIHNILREQTTGKFYLIDFDKCNIQHGADWKSTNLDRLLRSFRKERLRLGIFFDEKDWAMLLQGYQSF